MMQNHRTYVVNLQEVKHDMEDVLAGIKLVNYRNVQKISQRLLVNLKAPTVTENRRDDKYVLGKLRSKSGRNALSLLLYYVLILYITPFV